MAVATTDPSQCLQNSCLPGECECGSNPPFSHNKTQAPTPLPKLQVSVLIAMMLAEPITAHVMLPFIVQLVEETGITDGDVTKVGYYTGMLESLFFFIEALTILQWGRLSDRIGRRPVLLTGLFGLGLSMLCFGVSHTFGAVIASRGLAGALNGNAGVIKSTLGEITDETNVAQAFGLMPLVWSIGNTLAPMIGGLLQHPYERLGGIFHYSEFWRRNPYFLPCSIAACISASGFVLGYFFLQETIGSKGQHTRLQTNFNLVTERSPLLNANGVSSPSLRTLITQRVAIVISNYSLLAIVDISFCVLQPLFYSTPIQNGGLGMSPPLIGICMAGYGIASGVVSMIFFAPLTRKFGERIMATGCTFGYFGCFALFPLMNALARMEGRITLFVRVALVAQLALATLMPMAFSCTFIYLRAAAPSSSTLGSINGLAQTITSIMRGIGPAITTSLFAISVEYKALGGGLVYVMMLFVTTMATMATLLLPARPWKRME